MKKNYTLNDLTIRYTNRTTTDNGITAHTHTVLFERPLTVEEQEQFTQILKSVCETFDSSLGSDNNFLAKPNVTFTAPNLVHYTVSQCILVGSWKDELFARLAKFSHEVASISEHDGNPIFSKLRSLKQLQDWAHSQIDNSAQPAIRPDIAITVLQLIDEVERLQNQVKHIETQSQTA